MFGFAGEFLSRTLQRGFHYFRIGRKDSNEGVELLVVALNVRDFFFDDFSWGFFSGSEILGVLCNRCLRGRKSCILSGKTKL